MMWGDVDMLMSVAARVLQQVAVDTFAIPGDSGFPLGGLVRAPTSSHEAGMNNVHTNR